MQSQTAIEDVVNTWFCCFDKSHCLLPNLLSVLNRTGGKLAKKPVGCGSAKILLLIVTVAMMKNDNESKW